MKPDFFRRGLCALLTALVLLAPVICRAALEEADFKQWGLLAVQDDGRRKPLDTFAHDALLRITGGSFMGMDVYKDTAGRVWRPNDFLLSILSADNHDWRKEPLILVNYRPLVQQLGLDATRKRFSDEELSGLPAFTAAVQRVRALRAGGRDVQLTREQQEVENVVGRLELFHRLLDHDLAIIPPPGGAAADGKAWLGGSRAGDTTTAAYGETKLAPVAQRFNDTLEAYRTGNAYQFGSQARGLREELRSLNPVVYPSESALSDEYTYNHLGAFPWASFLYGAAAILLAAGGAGLTGFRRGLRWTGIGLGLAGLGLHATGIVLRCIVAGRPPVTNMYESVIWVAFVVVALGFAFYARYRGTTYLLAALPAGCLVLLLVQNLPVAISGSIEPLQPVLRDNFWLATHVTTETASYGAFALGMAFGHILLARYIINPVAARADSVLHFWLYRVLQLGVLLVTVGTILGAVWANYSWGRFWGWDPKETWAFITLLCYIVAIHGRIAGWWGQFGLAVASVVCFAAVVMAWYGVNFVLGKGLHSYGRGVGGEGYVVTFLVLDALFLAAACWRQAQGRRAVAGDVRSALDQRGAGELAPPPREEVLS